MATQLEKRSAELMLKKLRAKLDSLFQDQEQNKPVDNSQQPIPKFELGGWANKLNADPIASDQLSQDLLFQNQITNAANANINWANDPLIQSSQDAIIKGNFQNGIQTPSNMDMSNVKMDTVSNVSKTPGKFGEYAAMAGQLAPIAYNLFQGSRKPDQLDPKDYYNPYNGKINSLMADRRYNVDPGLASNTAAFNTYTSNLRNSGAMTPGQYRNNLLGAQNQRMMANAGQYANKQNQDNQYMAEEANSLMNTGNQIASTNLNVRNMNDQNSAAGRNFLAAGFGDMSQFAQMQQLMRNQKLSDKERMEIIKVLNARAPQYFQQTYQNRGFTV